jgi:alkanesulfonate monooxygenase SsuD/methylene tetrahydromethanopterin reductase-like flavin-dependent oxidoreductase (luciferase family)
VRHDAGVLIDVQFSPARNSWPVLRDAAQSAEAAGFGAVWVYDHLAGRSLRGDGMLEAFTLLGALAATTNTIALGTMVANVTMRAPGVLAVAAASVTAIADRPMLLGIGAGSSPSGPWAAELDAVGQPIEPTAAGRHARVEQTLDLLDAMWSPDRSDQFATFPLPHHRPPVYIGVNSVALAELAGRRADGVNVRWHHPGRDEFLTAATAAFRASGRTGDFAVTTWTGWDDALLDPEHEQRRAMEDRGIHRLVLAELGLVRPDHVGRSHPR